MAPGLWATGAKLTQSPRGCGARSWPWNLPSSIPRASKSRTFLLSFPAGFVKHESLRCQSLLMWEKVRVHKGDEEQRPGDGQAPHACQAGALNSAFRVQVFSWLFKQRVLLMKSHSYFVDPTNSVKPWEAHGPVKGLGRWPQALSCDNQPLEWGRVMPWVWHECLLTGGWSAHQSPGALGLRFLGSWAEKGARD